MKKTFALFAMIAALTLSVSASAQQILSGAANVFSNSVTQAAIPLVGNFATGQHQATIIHNTLLTTTNFSGSVQVGLVDAISGLTNWTTVAQTWTAANTNAATEVVVLTNYAFAPQVRVVLTTTNVFNIPTSIGAATLVTNTIILNY